jgi:hypothetical protein
MSSSTVGNFATSNSLYAYLDGKFRQVTPTEIVASQKIYYRSKVSGTVSKPTAWVTIATNKYNDTISVGNGGWSTKVTPIAASKAENVDKYLYLYTCEQRKRLDGTVECTDITLDENTTIIDGGNIITHTVTAEQLNATSINASKSLTVGAMTDAAAATILNSNINVGGRNLSVVADYEEGYLQPDTQNLGTMDDTRQEHTSAYIPVEPDETYVFQNWIAPTTGDSEYLWMAYQLYDSSKALVGNRTAKTAGVDTGLPQHEMYVITIPTGVAFIRISARLYSDGKMKLERGNTATDWTPAPEDTDDAIVNVASDISESLENMDGTLNDFANTLEEQSTDIGESINEVQDQLDALREDFESEVNAREQ